MNRLQILIWHIGRHSKITRGLYHKLTGGNWLWGIMGWLRDYQIKDPTPCTVEDIKGSHEWIDEHLEELFKDR